MTEYPMGQPLPPLTRDVPDELLSAWIMRNPGFLAKAQTAATGAWKAARALPGLTTRVDGMWTTFVARARQQAEPVGQLRVAVQAHAVLRALAGLSQAHSLALSDKYAALLAGPRMNGNEIAEKVRVDARAAMASQPDLAWFQGEEDAVTAARETAQERSRQEQQARFEAERPAALLKSLRSRKIALSLNEDGKLTVPAGTALGDADRAAIVADRAALVELLTAEIEAARPLVVA